MSGSTLVCGYRSGDFTDALLALDPVIHAFDVYHAHAIERKWGRAVACSAQLPPGPFDEAYLKAGPKLLSAELLLDLLQGIYLALSDGGVLHVTFEGSEADALAALKKIFPRVKKVRGDKHATWLEARREGELKRVRSFACEWPASVPGGEPLMFTSYPGCFCHRRVDAGGLALAETVVARELAATDAAARPLKVLDMGCGCGLVGLLVADAARRLGGGAAKAPELTMIDSHARAVAAAAENAARFGIAAECVLADDGVPRDAAHLGVYDVFVGNPPYYSDYRIADVFLQTAWAALRPGGRCYTVVKTATGLLPVQEKYFRRAEVFRRRNYAVLCSIR